jgi:hypothetical protein
MRKIETYERFHRHIAAWLDREIDPVLVVGPPGVGKSHAYASRLGNRPYHRFGGRQTPLHVYKSLHDDPHLPVVLDDISALLQEDCFRDMLKGLCESGERNLHWGTTTSKLEGRPRSFRCTSPVLIVMNKIPARDADVAAILDRCDAIEFAPTKSDVITRMREVFPADDELIDLIAELPTLPSLRTLIKARRWQNSRHLRLVEELLAECGAPQAVVHLARIIENHPESEWCDRYVAETGLTDRTYRRHRRLALQLVDCRASPERCPDVRESVPDRSSTAADESNGCDTQP